jgi:putative endonuclease
MARLPKNRRSGPPPAFVYVVRCADGTLYTGYAVNLDQRLHAHNQGRGAKYTSGRRPVALVYAAPCLSKSEALKRERQIKRWPRDKKEALVATAPTPAGPSPSRRGRRPSAA